MPVRFPVAVVVLLFVTLCSQHAVAQRTLAERQALLEEYKALKQKVKELKVQVKEDKQYADLEKFLGKKIEKLKEAHNLNEEQVRRLVLAARGAVERHVAQMKGLDGEEADLPIWIDGYEEYFCRVGDLIFLGNNPHKQALQHQPIWVNVPCQP